MDLTNAKKIRKISPIKYAQPWHQKINWPLILGITVAILLNGYAILWMMKQPLPPFLYHLADNMNGLFKPIPTPCPPFESSVIKSSSGKIIEKQYVVPTFLVPHNRLPFPPKKENQNPPLP